MLITEKIKDLAVETFNIDRTKLDVTTNFFVDLGADSLLMLSFITALEREFNVEVSDEDFDAFYCVENVEQFISSKSAA